MFTTNITYFQVLFRPPYFSLSHKLQYSELAVQDLFNIFENIAKDKPNSALDYISELKEYIELLENNPNMGVDCKTKNKKHQSKLSNTYI